MTASPGPRSSPLPSTARATRRLNRGRRGRDLESKSRASPLTCDGDGEPSAFKESVAFWRFYHHLLHIISFPLWQLVFGNHVFIKIEGSKRIFTWAASRVFHLHNLQIPLRSPVGGVTKKKSALNNLERGVGLWWCLSFPWRRRPARGLVGPGDGPRCPTRRGRARGASGRRLEHRRTAVERGAGRLMSVMADPTSAALLGWRSLSLELELLYLSLPTTLLILHIAALLRCDLGPVRPRARRRRSGTDR